MCPGAVRVVCPPSSKPNAGAVAVVMCIYVYIYILWGNLDSGCVKEGCNDVETEGDECFEGRGR